MQAVILIEEAHVGVQHHLATLFLVFWPVDEGPLVLFQIATDGPIWTPAMHHNVLEVIIIENLLIVWITPHTIVARILWLGTTYRVCTWDGCRERPSFLLIQTSTNIEYVIDKYILKVIATIFGIGHETMTLWTLVVCFSSVPKLVPKLLKKCVCFELVVRVIAKGDRTDHCLSCNHHEVRKTDRITPFVIHLFNTRPLEAWGQPCIVRICEVYASIRTSSSWSTFLDLSILVLFTTEVHKVVAGKPDHTGCVLCFILGQMLMCDYLWSQVLILFFRKLLCLTKSFSAAF